MAQHARGRLLRPPWGRARMVGGAAASASRQMHWLWSRESLMRMGLSTLLAIALWLYVTNKQQPGYLDFGQPIQLNTANLGAGFALTNQLNPVRIRYRTDNRNIYLTPSNFQAEVNLSRLGPGVHKYVPVQVTADPGITILRVTPNYVTVALDQIKTKQVPVTARLLGGRPPIAYQAGAVSITPNLVTVRGPERLVSQIAQANVTYYLQNQTTSISETEVPVLADSQGVPVTIPVTSPSDQSSLTVTPKEVRVRVPIKAAASFKTIPVTPLTSGHPRAGYGLASISVQPPEVTSEGPASILSGLESVSTSPLSLSGRGAGHFTTRLTVKLPKHVVADTTHVTVKVTLRPVAASSTTQVGVVPAHVPSFLSVSTHPAYVLITLVGSSSRLAGAARSASAVVDLAGYSAGTYYLTPSIYVPPGLTVLNVQPRTVQVNLRATP